MNASNPSIQAALAAFSIADRERLAEAAGREYSVQDTQAVALRCGPEATRLALVVRGEMLAHEASTLEAAGAIKRARGAA
jgi:hypothetical protein